VATSSRLRRCFSALPRTSPMTIQSINPKVFFSFCVAFKVGIQSVAPPPPCLLACSLDVLLPIWVWILSLQLSVLWPNCRKVNGPQQSISILWRMW
jgi:hypothetical protein